MNSLQITTHPDVGQVFNNYPPAVRKKIRNLRRLILDVASNTEDISDLEETLKCGEPSYLTKHGSTIRIDWKARTPDQYAMYFKCTSRLVSSFKAVYGETFRYEGDRAIVFQMDDGIPDVELKHCIAAGLRYHKVKQLPLLGLVPTKKTRHRETPGLKQSTG